MSKLKSTSTNSITSNTYNIGGTTSQTTAASTVNFAKPVNNAKQQTQSNSADGVYSQLKAGGACPLNNQKIPLTTRNQAKQLECLKDVNVLQQQKKKRTALENISNAGTGTNSNSINLSKAEVTKKSRYSVFAVSSVIGNKKVDTSTAKNATTTTTTNSLGLAVEPNKKSSSKENLNNLIPASFGTNLLPASFNPSIKKQPFQPTTTTANNKIVTKSSNLDTAKTNAATFKQQSAAPILTSNKSLSASLVLNKNDLKAKETKQEKVKLESKTNEAYTCTESSIERQLATTTLSASGEALNSLDSTALLKEFVSELNQNAAAENLPGWEDIDAGEIDEFNANDYVTFIFKYYRERENQFVIDDYIKRQPHINRQMRLLLVDWMVEVQQQLEFSHEVLYLSVKLLDLYLNGRKVDKEKLQLLGGAAMFIACKFEERMPPIIDDFIYVSDSAYDRKELIKMEIDILKTVKFDIGIPLSYTFLRRYSKCIRADMKFLTLARYILELSLQDYNFSYVRDSIKACASLYLAMKMAVAYEKTLKENGNAENAQPAVNSANLTSTDWNATLVHYTGSFTRDFIEFIPLMNNLIKTAFSSKYKTIFKKYSHQVFFEVAKIPHLSETDIESLVNSSKSEGSF
jgi:hypothetical protein